MSTHASTDTTRVFRSPACSAVRLRWSSGHNSAITRTRTPVIALTVWRHIDLRTVRDDSDTEIIPRRATLLVRPDLQVAKLDSHPTMMLEGRDMARMGMLTPSSNTVLEPTTTAMLSGLPDVTVHFTRFK